MAATPRSEGAGSSEWLRTHALFLAALTLGVAMRVAVTGAYRPALIFPDSLGYLARADPFEVHNTRPSGYSLFLRPFVLLTHSLSPIPIAQHLMGLGLAVLCYAFLVRRGLPRWGATAAVLPLLLDPLQLVLEHYVLSDVLFEVMLVGACLLLLWRRRPGVGSLVLCGALVGCAGFVRGAGSLLLVVFLVALVCLRVGWVRIVAFLVAAIVPLAAYAVAFHHRYGEYAVSTAGPRFLYARLAPVVRCDDLSLPHYERMLCPRAPVGERPSTDWFMWGRKQGPQWHVHGPPGMTQVQVLEDFDKRVVRAEPVVYAKAALGDAARGFAPVRTVQVPGYPASYWLFADHYWSVDTFIHRHVLRARIRAGTGYSPPGAQFLTTYRQWVYTPGPLLGALLLVAAAATVGLGRARGSGDRVAIGLLAAGCTVPLLTAVGLSGFSWRYQLPQIPLLPVAGALGLAALQRRRPPGDPAPDPPRILDRLAGRIARLPMPAAWRPAVRGALDRGSFQVGVAVIAAPVAAFLAGILAVASGWFAPGSGVLLGVTLAVLGLLALLVGEKAGAA